ncbi:hypothetical protein CJD44_11290 [Streptomyces sp. alain-838]|nr:hypothetical protein [Streptomyces sp. alain-838]PAK26257.1 hypothetical protein CJD44_11290 [Streptomyces sp. alain-838]
MIWHLLHQPVWFGGVASVVAAVLLQAVALGTGSISVVESLLVLDLPVALAPVRADPPRADAATRVGGRRGEAAGLAGMLLSLSPSEGSTPPGVSARCGRSPWEPTCC